MKIVATFRGLIATFGGRNINLLRLFGEIISVYCDKLGRFLVIIIVYCDFLGKQYKIIATFLGKNLY